MTPRGQDPSNTAHACCRLPASHTGACQNAGNRHRSCMRRCRPTHSRRPAIAPIASVVIDHRCYWPLLARSAGPASQIEAAAQALNVGASVFQVRRPEEIATAFEAIAKAQFRAVFVAPDSVFTSEAAQIAKLAVTHQLPSMHQLRDEAEAGGLCPMAPTSWICFVAQPYT
jgi:hypothetical protein